MGNMRSINCSLEITLWKFNLTVNNVILEALNNKQMLVLHESYKLCILLKPQKESVY